MCNSLSWLLVLVSQQQKGYNIITSKLFNFQDLKTSTVAQGIYTLICATVPLYPIIQKPLEVSRD